MSSTCTVSLSLGTLLDTPDVSSRVLCMLGLERRTEKDIFERSDVFRVNEEPNPVVGEVGGDVD